jgi:uracil-DNA glycosylase family 4
VDAGDGLALHGGWLTAVNRCAPPDNKPTPHERDACLPFLEAELALLEQARVIVCLGAWAWDGTLRALAALGTRVVAKPRFGHGAEVEVGPWHLVGCYHPSQQNTFTGRLTPAMLDRVLARATELADEPANRPAAAGRTFER